MWPWYSQIAPISWIIARDVQEGRAEVSFSTWNRYSTQQQVKKLKESWEEVAEGEMPPWFYSPCIAMFASRQPIERCCDSGHCNLKRQALALIVSELATDRWPSV